MPGVLDRCEKTLLEVLLMFVPFPDTGRGIFLVVNGVYVQLSVAIGFLLLCGQFLWFCW